MYTNGCMYVCKNVGIESKLCREIWIEKIRGDAVGLMIRMGWGLKDKVDESRGFGIG